MIVCMSRRICVDLHNALIKLRTEWEAKTLKVVMTGSAEDGPEWQKHIRSKDARRKLANRFKDSRDFFQIVIVREDVRSTCERKPCSCRRNCRVQSGYEAVLRYWQLGLLSQLSAPNLCQNGSGDCHRTVSENTARGLKQ